MLGGSMPLPSISAGSPLFQTFNRNIVFSSGIRRISAQLFSSISFSKKYLFTSLKQNPSDTLPALPFL